MRFFFWLMCLGVFVAKAADKPNIILLMGDDHGWIETDYNGHPHLKTPMLDEMAQTGLRLDHFYAGHPSCSPTRGSVLTGRHPNRYGTFAPGWSLRAEEITIAHLLAKAGYRCGHFGKWHVGPVKKSSPTNPRAMGFHAYVSHDNFYEMNPPFSRNGGPPEIIKGEGSEATIAETLRFIADAKKRKQPFLAVVWFGSPHEPYSELAKDLALYDNLPAKYAERKVRLTSNETGRPTQRPLREVLRERYAEITAMDRAIGKLRTRLTELNLRDNTVLWYCGDNGSPRSYGRVVTPFRAEKGHVYEGGIRVPGLIEWPAKIKKGRVSKVNGVTSDMLPTLCEWAAVELPKRPLDGISLAPLVAGKLKTRSKPIGFWSYNSHRATRDGAKPYYTAEQQQGTTPLVKFLGGRRTRNFRNVHQPPIEEADYAGARVWLDNRFKLVIPGKADAAPELYDLQTDPAEEKNLAKMKPDLTARLARDLRAWQSSVLNSLREKDYPGRGQSRTAPDTKGQGIKAKREFLVATDVPAERAAPGKRVLAWDTKALFQKPKMEAMQLRPTNGLRAFFYEGAMFKGKPTRVFAYYGAPMGEVSMGGWPAVVCAHGGGGTAYSEWVRHWNNRGFAALAMDLEGHCRAAGSIRSRAISRPAQGIPVAGPRELTGSGIGTCPTSSSGFTAP